MGIREKILNEENLLELNELIKELGKNTENTTILQLGDRVHKSKTLG